MLALSCNYSLNRLIGMENNSIKSMTISRSPIDFVLVGPKGSRNGVLVRSEQTTLDLIGFAASGSIDYSLFDMRFNRSLFAWVFARKREMHAITTTSLKERPDKYDSRK